MVPVKRIRLVDVASALGVAPSTVSRALAGSDAVSAETTARVRAAALELGYAVNPVASGLKRGQTLNIGLVAVMSYWFSGGVTSGADRVAADRGYDFVVMHAVGGSDRELLLQRARRLGQRVDGALVVDIEDGPVLDSLIEALGVPVVTLGCKSATVPSVLVDNERIGQLAADHLNGLGHRSAVVLSPFNPSRFAFDNSSIRARSFSSAFVGNVRTAEVPGSSHADRQRSIIEATTAVSAVFCTTDSLALEAVAALREAGRSVPDTVSVVGVDDHPLAGPLGLTTIAQTPEEMGEVAASMIIDVVEGRSDPTVLSVQSAVRLVERRTSARAVN